MYYCFTFIIIYDMKYVIIYNVCLCFFSYVTEPVVSFLLYCYYVSPCSESLNKLC